MTDILIQPNADADDNLANGVVINDATLPLSNQDAATLGLTLGTTYKARVLGDPATFSVTDVPAQMSAPTLAVDSETQITATLASDPADNGSAINGYDLRYSTDEATWTEEIGITSPHAITGLSGSTLYYVQTRATNGNGAGAWSASASSATSASPPVLASVTITDDGGGNGTMTLTFDAGEPSGQAVDVWLYIDNPGDTDPADGAAVAAGTGAVDAIGPISTTVGASSVPITLGSGYSGTYDVFVTAAYDSGSTYSNVVSDTGVAFDTTAPTVSSYSPADGATDVAIASDLVMTFSETMDMTTGTITLKDATDGSTVETFTIGSDGTWSTTTNTDDTLTLNPASDLSNSTGYYVQYSGLQDANGNALPDVSDTTTWNFTTEAAAPSYTETGIVCDGSTETDWSNAVDTADRAAALHFASFEIGDTSNIQFVCDISGMVIAIWNTGALRASMKQSGGSVSQDTTIGSPSIGDRVNILQTMKYNGVNMDHEIWVKINSGSWTQEYSGTIAGTAVRTTDGFAYAGRTNDNAYSFNGSLFGVLAFASDTTADIPDITSSTVRDHFVNSDGTTKDPAAVETDVGIDARVKLYYASAADANAGGNAGLAGGTGTVTGAYT